jgi:hypothetical protein
MPSYVAALGHRVRSIGVQGAAQPRPTTVERGWPIQSRWCVVTAANAAGQVRPPGFTGRSQAGFVRPVATVDLPVAEAMAGGVQPRGRDGVVLPCLVCGELFMARRVDRRTCSPGCARRDRAARAAARLRLGRACEGCGRMFVAGRADKRFCSSACRVRAYRRRGRRDADRRDDVPLSG